MAWISGVLGKFPHIEGVFDKLKDFQTEREERGFILKSVIKMNSIVHKLTEETELYSGVVMDEYLRIPHKLIEREEGVWEVTEGEPTVDLRYGYFWITEGSIIIVDRSENKEFVFRVVSEALGGGENSVRPVRIDIQRIASDYYGHWLGSIVDREGNMQSGTFYGENLEDDDVIGREYIRCNKRQIGIVTDYFGAPVKVRITRDGTVMIMANIARENYVQFIKDNILPYVQEAVSYTHLTLPTKA